MPRVLVDNSVRHHRFPLIRIDAVRVVTMMADYLTNNNNPQIFAGSQGSYEWYIPGGEGHQFVGFGQIPLVREYSSRQKGSGGLLWSARFGFDSLVQNYRGYEFPRQGTPHTKPTLVVKPGANASSYNAYVSWSGATRVTSYNAYEGATNGSLPKTGSVSKAGFETTFVVPQNWVQVGVVEGSNEVSRSEVQQA